MNTKEYVRELLALNVSVLQGRTVNAYYATVSHGLTEELLELAEVEGRNSDAEVKELGDVFAYAALLLLSHAIERELHMLAIDTTDSICTEVADELENAIERRMQEPLTKLALVSAGTFKRYFRGEGLVSEHLIAHLAASALANFSYSASEIFSTNISKLKSRAKRGLLDRGSGNDR